MAPPGGDAQPQMPKMPNLWPMLIMMLLIFGLYGFDRMDIGWDFAKLNNGSISHNLGYFMNFAFGWLGGLGNPVLVLMIMGTIMVTLTSILRTLLTDTIAQRKGSEFSSAFNKEMRQARIENNTYKLRKLTEMQPQVMAKSMEASSASMKSMPWTMIIIVPMFLWVRFYVGVTLGGDGVDAGGMACTISVPWAMINDGQGGVNLMQSYVFPAWMLIYSLVSIPIGQFVSRVVRYFQFKKRLEAIESGAATPTAAGPDIFADAKTENVEPINIEPDNKPINQNEEPPKEGS